MRTHEPIGEREGGDEALTLCARRSVFYSSAFTQVDQEMATKLEISRGLMAAKIAFAKVMYAKNFFVDDHVVGKKNRFLGESDDDFDF